MDAENAIMVAVSAIVISPAAMHKDQAFQASSPKNFTAGRMTGLFFGPGFWPRVFWSGRGAGA
jgi:hypothetical protein